MRAYIPPETYAKLTEQQQKMWRDGMVARLLVQTGVPIIAPETLPIISYRINMLNRADAMGKIAMGMPPAEVHVPDVVTPDLISVFMGAVVEGSPFVAMGDEQFIRRMVGQLAELMLPADKVLEWTVKANELLKRADEEQSNQ